MRYIFVSDIHGNFDKLKSALETANFNADTDTLVSVGDAFDRGFQSKEVLEFLMSLPHRILIMGNHDYRWLELMRGAHAETFDAHNGVRNSLMSFCELPKTPSLYWGFQVLQSDDKCRATRDLIWEYLHECVWAAEWSNLIATHGWIPTNDTYITNGYGYPKLARMEAMEDLSAATNDDWYNAVWADTGAIVTSFRDAAFPMKSMIVGHWHAFDIAARFGESRIEMVNGLPEIADFSTFHYEAEYADVYFIDGCTAMDKGVVNVISIETDEEPVLHKVKWHN